MANAKVTPEQVIAIIDKAFPGAARGKKDWYADASKAPHVRAISTLLDQIDPRLLPESGDEYITLTSIKEAIGHAIQRWDGGPLCQESCRV